ncbi:MAG: hypothetical protein RR921_05945, partial [Mucinivorans sp.]
MESIREASANVVCEKKCHKTLSLNLLILIASITLTFSAGLIIPDATSALYLVTVTIGVVVAIIFAIKLVSGSKKLVYTPTGSLAQEHSVFFKSDELEKLMYAIETSNTQNLKTILSPNNSGVRLDIIDSADGKFAACQIMKYVPYYY